MDTSNETLMTAGNPSGIPILPIRNTVLFPSLVVPLRVGRPKSVAAIEAVARLRPEQNAKGGLLLVLTQKKSDVEQVGVIDLYPVGTLIQVDRIQGNAQNGYQIIARGLKRYQLVRGEEIATDGDQPYLVCAEGLELPDQVDLDAETKRALLESMKKLSLDVLELVPGETKPVEEMVRGIEDLEYLTHLAAGNMEIALEARQSLLELTSLKERSLKLLELLQTQYGSIQIQNELREKLGRKMGQNQREHILREQLRTIREELGEGESDSGSADGLRKKIEEAGLPEAPKKVALDELKRLEAMGGQSPEANIIRNYIETIVALPWSKRSDPQFDLEKARAVLDQDHSGLEKVKKRILEHLSVMKLKGADRGSILLLVGPPGVGKTSLGQSVARAMGRKYIRASLGGVRDESDVRGHRRTYIGAMPGRILQSMKRVGENNPVFVLDEIDKMGRGYGGDPASALLEVLDPEQNTAFFDHYLDLPFDLSQVFFIATANSLEGIPAPLLDRMEVIELSGYTFPEKLKIAEYHLVARQCKENGIQTSEVDVTTAVLSQLISSYTREAGVRDLDRKIAQVLRGVGARVLELRNRGGTGGPVQVTVSDVEEALGPERYTLEDTKRALPVGVVTGLAWTPVGGDILYIETTQMPGSGKLVLTGQLGDVMKESAQIALSLLRSRLPALGLNVDFEKRDFHIHVPSGSIPKDGPSAGVTLLTALTSLVTDHAVDSKLAMTGEITLRGAVTPVGGIREKLIAAHRSGVKRVLLPMKNKKDLRELPEETRKELQIEFVETVEELLQKALGLAWPTQPLPFGMGAGNRAGSGAGAGGILARTE